jgi:hypothetical protein
MIDNPMPAQWVQNRARRVAKSVATAQLSMHNVTLDCARIGIATAALIGTFQ